MAQAGWLPRLLGVTHCNLRSRHQTAFVLKCSASLMYIVVMNIHIHMVYLCVCMHMVYICVYVALYLFCVNPKSFLSEP